MNKPFVTQTTKTFFFFTKWFGGVIARPNNAFLIRHNKKSELFLLFKTQARTDKLEYFELFPRNATPRLNLFRGKSMRWYFWDESWKCVSRSPTNCFSALDFSPTQLECCIRWERERAKIWKYFKASDDEKKTQIKDLILSSVPSEAEEYSQRYAQKKTISHKFLYNIFNLNFDRRDIFRARARARAGKATTIIRSFVLFYLYEEKWDKTNATRKWVEGERSENFLSNNHVLSTWPSDTFIYHRFLLDKLFPSLWFILT